MSRSRPSPVVLADGEQGVVGPIVVPQGRVQDLVGRQVPASQALKHRNDVDLRRELEADRAPEKDLDAARPSITQTRLGSSDIRCFSFDANGCTLARGARRGGRVQVTSGLCNRPRLNDLTQGSSFALGEAAYAAP